MSYTANAINQYTAVGPVSPTYDGNGNLTSDGTYTFGYDAEADVFQQAINAGITEGEGVLTVDRDLCLACGQNGAVKSMAGQVGISPLTIQTPSGTTTIMP